MKKASHLLSIALIVGAAMLTGCGDSDEPAGSGGGTSTNGTGGTGTGGMGTGGTGTGGTGGGGTTDTTDPVDDCSGAACDPEMDIVSADLDCTGGDATVTVSFAMPMAEVAADQSSRTATFMAGSEEHALEASAFASDYTCGYRVNFEPLPLPDGASCGVVNGEMVFVLPAAAASEPFTSVLLESSFYNGSAVIGDELGPLPICGG